ncbi:unnamed protein product [marine sediment metagenome]|uniref:Uncharacterized protein n=1 Tax=marine sediment metagenome TaxID=412755 RepID=X1PLP6_9ZZZZ
MKAKRRRLGQYRCWLCGKDLKITTPPYLRAGCCRCEEEGLPGGSCVPYDLTEEQIEYAKREYARTHGE